MTELLVLNSGVVSTCMNTFMSKLSIKLLRYIYFIVCKFHLNKNDQKYQLRIIHPQIIRST